MIIFLILVSVVVFAFSYIFESKPWHKALFLGSGLVFVTSVVLLTLNFTEHFGMEQATENQAIELVSDADVDGMNLLLFQQVGDQDEKVYLYRTDKEKEPAPTDMEKTSNTVESGEVAELVVETNYWTYNNYFYKLLFNLSGNDEEVIEVINHFKLPEDWEVLSVEQAQALFALVKERQADLEQAAQSFVEQELGKELVKNPDLSQAEQKKLIQKFSTAYQAKVLEAMLAEINQ